MLVIQRFVCWGRTYLGLGVNTMSEERMGYGGSASGLLMDAKRKDCCLRGVGYLLQALDNSRSAEIAARMELARVCRKLKEIDVKLSMALDIIGLLRGGGERCGSVEHPLRDGGE